MSDIDFSISDGPLRILAWKSGGCRPATIYECALWDRIEQLERELDHAKNHVAELEMERDRFVDELASARSEARKTALEEAAKAAETRAQEYDASFDTTNYKTETLAGSAALVAIAAAIRLLAEQEGSE